VNCNFLPATSKFYVILTTPFFQLTSLQCRIWKKSHSLHISYCTWLEKGEMRMKICDVFVNVTYILHKTEFRVLWFPLNNRVLLYSSSCYWTYGNSHFLQGTLTSKIIKQKNFREASSQSDVQEVLALNGVRKLTAFCTRIHVHSHI